MSQSDPFASTSSTQGAKASNQASSTLLPPDYTPSEKEEYMNDQHVLFFRRKLLAWRQELIRESSETIHQMKEQVGHDSDIADRASTETDRSLELRTRDRERKLIVKIDEALRRLDDGSYGYCEETGEPIGLNRLIARPIATLSIEAQERHERDERIHREA